MDIRQKTLDFALDLVNPMNIDSVITLLQKEITKTRTEEVDKAADYRKVLIKAIHSCALKFPDIAGKVVHALMDHLGDSDVASAVNVITFGSEVVETYPEHRESVVRKLLQSISEIRSSAVLRVSLWIVGEYCESVEDLDIAFTQLKKLLGKMPLLEESEEEEEENNIVPEAEKKPAVTKTNTKVLADGTYATQSAYVPQEETTSTSAAKSKIPFLRGMKKSFTFFFSHYIFH